MRGLLPMFGFLPPRPIARACLVLFTAMTSSACGDCFPPGPGDEAMPIAACPQKPAWPAAPPSAASFSEALLSRPRWARGARSATISFGATQDPIDVEQVADRDAEFEAASGDVTGSAAERPLVLCRVTGSSGAQVFATLGAAVVETSIPSGGSHGTFSVPGLALARGATVRAVETTSHVTDKCWRNPLLLGATTCAVNQHKSTSNAASFQGSYPVVAGGSPGLACRAMARETVERAVSNRLTGLEAALADACKHQATVGAAGGGWRTLEDRIEEVAAYVGWSDPRVAAALSARNAVQKGWVDAMRARAVSKGSAIDFGPSLPRLHMAGPLRCGPEARKRATESGFIFGDASPPCTLELDAEAPSAGVTLKASSEGMSAVGVPWGVDLELFLADGTEIDLGGGVFSLPIAKGSDRLPDSATIVGGAKVRASWVAPIPKGLPTSSAVLRIRSSRPDRYAFVSVE